MFVPEHYQLNKYEPPPANPAPPFTPQVSINGYITFNTKFSISTMPDVGSPRLVPLAFLAPYWADIDIPQGSATSGLYHVELSLADTFTDNETKALFDEYKMLADLGSDFHPVFISVITWVDVLPYQAGDFANMQVRSEGPASKVFH